ncbi:hypothetical protein [Bradyrhizobium oligotrophicum]|uniref:hypothetical protein n=1 Tax=Bradyrhizobium oligotrophicum TaxID=44255 RepID=UPI003EBC0DE0
MPMKMIALAGALCLLLSSSMACRANSGPWCRPDAAILSFKNQQGHDLARIELRALKPNCNRNPEKLDASVERSMRIEHGGGWTDVPAECVAGVSFEADGLALSGDDSGLGIALAGKSTDTAERVRLVIYKSRERIACFRIEPCPSAEDQSDEVRECYRELTR